MAQIFSVHAQNPQPRIIARAVQALRSGGVIVYPTDSCYALGCQLGDKSAMERLRRIRQIGEDHHLTLVCRDLSQIGQYAHISDRQYRLLRMTTPGSYTFILRGSREVPKRSLNPKGRTIGVRVPDHPVVTALLADFGEPILSSTLILPDEKRPLSDPDEIRARLKHDVDLILDAGSCGEAMTTIVDLTGETSSIVRAGKGSLDPFMEPSAA